MPNTYIPLGHSIDGAWPRNEHQPVCTACVHACYPSNRGLTRTTPPWLLSSTGQQGAVMGHVASGRNITVLFPPVSSGEDDRRVRDPKGTGDPGEKRSMVHVRVRAHLELASLALAQSAPSLRRRAPAPPALPRPTGYWGWPSGQVPPSGRQRLRGEGGWRSSMFWPESMT